MYGINKENKGITEDGCNWLYKCDPYKEWDRGYSDYEDVFTKYRGIHEEFPLYEEAKKKDIVEELFEIYRSVNIFPIAYYSKYGIEKAITQLYNNQPYYDGKILQNKANTGLKLCKFTHPIQHQITRNDKDPCMIDKFYDDDILKKAIKGSITTNKSADPAHVLNFLTLIGSTATNFKPLSAQAMVERYTPYGGVVFDSSQGIGGRILGTLTSQKNLTYIGSDPWKETNICNAKIGQYCEEVLGRKNAYKLFCIGSEKMRLSNEGIADFSFTSPPYFDLEHYSDDETQCYNAYPDITKWFKAFCGMTIKNTYNILKPGAFYCVNIADFNYGGKVVNYVDSWKRLAEQVGFEYIHTGRMLLTSRIGAGVKNTKRDLENTKSEPILTFRKPLDMNNFGNNVKIDVEF